MMVRVLVRVLLVGCGALLFMFVSSPWVSRQDDSSDFSPGLAKVSEPTGQQAQSVEVRLDLRKGTARASQGDRVRLVVPSQRLHATIVLPEEAVAGDYDVQVLDSRRSAVASATSQTRADEPIKMLRTTLDLSSQAAGGFKLAIRQQSGDWRLFDLIVR